MNAGKNPKEQSIARHRVEDARLAQQQHQHDRRKPDHGADIDQHAQPGELRTRSVDRHKYGMRHIQRQIWRKTGHHQRHQDVQNRADNQ